MFLWFSFAVISNCFFWELLLKAQVQALIKMREGNALASLPHPKTVGSGTHYHFSRSLNIIFACI